MNDQELAAKRYSKASVQARKMLLWLVLAAPSNAFTLEAMPQHIKDCLAPLQELDRLGLIRLKLVTGIGRVADNQVVRTTKDNPSSW